MQAMKFYNSVSTSTRGQARRAQNLVASPKSPVNIVRSDAEKGWERIARSYALETYMIPWCEYWPFLDTYINLSSNEGLRLLEFYLQQRILQSQVLKTIDQLEKFSCQYLSIDQEKISNENDQVLNSISQLIQHFYDLIDLLNLSDFVLNRSYRSHLESGGFKNGQNQDLIDLKTNLIRQLQWLSKENKHLLSLFNRPLLNSLTMVFTLLISPSGCALIDQIQQHQFELRRHQQKVRPASRLSLIGLVCSKRRKSTRRAVNRSSTTLIRSNSWPDLSTVNEPTASLRRRCRSQNGLEAYSPSSSSVLPSSNVSMISTQRISLHELTQTSRSMSNTSLMYASQTSVDMLREDRTKVEKWHYFLAG